MQTIESNSTDFDVNSTNIQSDVSSAPLKQEHYSSVITVSKSSLILSLLLVFFIIIGSTITAFYFGQMTQTNVISEPSSLETDSPQIIPSQTNIPLNTALPSTTSPSPTISAIIPAVDDEPAYTPVGWKRTTYQKLNLSIAYPQDWTSEAESFADISQELIRFWQGKDESSSTIQLTIKDSWDNSRVYGKNFTVNEELGITAQQADPPKMEESKLDRYQTQYGFEYQNKIYILSCVHNWIPSIYTQCQDMLKSIQWLP